MITLRQQLAEMQKELDLNVQAGKATQIIEKCNQICARTDLIVDRFAKLQRQYPAQLSLPQGIAVHWSPEQLNELKLAAGSVSSLRLQWRRWLKIQAVDTPRDDDAPVQEGMPQEDEPVLNTEEPAAYDIIQNDRLTKCVEQLKGVHDTFSTQLIDAWDMWLSELHQHTHVDDKTLSTQKNADKFDSIATEYEALRKVFNALTQGLPEDSSKIEQIKTAAEKLHTLRGMMKTDWPEAVQAFFDRINGPQYRRPTLSALTPEVLQWLAAEEMLDEFVITRK